MGNMLGGLAAFGNQATNAAQIQMMVEDAQTAQTTMLQTRASVKKQELERYNIMKQLKKAEFTTFSKLSADFLKASLQTSKQMAGIIGQ